MSGLNATYINSTSFSVVGDQTTIFNEGRRTRTTCSGVYGYGTVVSSAYSSPNTTVVISDDSLNSYLTKVYYGISSNTEGSLPEHDHSSNEGEGGTFSLLNLSDTPASFDDTKYLKSTTSGVDWTTMTESEITDLDKYTQSEVDTLITTISGKLDDHDELNNLDYASAGHTGFAETIHTHTESQITDLDKYTQSEVDTISGSLSSEIDSDISTHTSNADAHHNQSHTVVSHSDTTATGAELDELTDGSDTSLHIHDNRYYTESEVDTISGSLSSEIDSDISTHTSNTDAHHNQSHTVASHSDTTGTGAELDELTDGSETSLHIHDDMYYRESEVDTISGSLQTQLDTKLENVVEDITPQLGGNLDLQTNKIVGDGGTEGISIDSSGNVNISNDVWFNGDNYADTDVINMLKVNVDDEIDVGGTLVIGAPIEAAEDSGMVVLSDMPVSATPTAGDEMSFTHKIDGDNVLTVGAEADSAGGVTGHFVQNHGALKVHRTAVGAADYAPSILTSDYIIAMTDTAAARACTISTEDVQSGSTDNPRVMVVKDESGGSGAQNITITLENGGTIDGGVNAVISANFNSVTLYLTGTNGFIY